MIELHEVSYRVEGATLLSGITLDLSEHRIAVIGANGSGKSTFARLLNGLLEPTAGEVIVQGMDTKTRGREVRRQVGFVFQNPDNQIVFPTVAEDLAFGLKNLGLDVDECKSRVTDMLEFCGLDGFEDRLIHQLSGGEKQLVAVAGVLVMRPAVIVFDEPTTLLDLQNKSRIHSAIDRLEQQAIVVTHDLDLISEFERVICFAGGRVVADGPAVEVIEFYRAEMA
ncbi:MAG: ABC transporter ATP-binding protein [Pseudomonadota bacterium]